MKTMTDFIFLGFKITADSDCSHEIKRHLLLGREVMTNLDSILKSSDITLSIKVLLVKAMVFSVGQLFASGGQSTGASASTSVLPMNIQGWFPLRLTDLLSKGLPRVFSNTTVSKHQFFGTQPSLWSNSHPHMTTGKTIALTRWTFVDKVMSLLFNMLSQFVIASLPRNKRLLISWLQSPSAVILEPKKIKSFTVSTVFPFICHEVIGPDVMIIVFWLLSFKPAFSLPSFTFIKKLFSSSSLFAIMMLSSAYRSLLIFLPAILIPACASSSPAFLMMYSAYKLNK